jgi:toxin-antitoxin system PIN domain toxin
MPADQPAATGSFLTFCLCFVTNARQKIPNARSVDIKRISYVMSRRMRTTLTLDDDVAATLQRVQKKPTPRSGSTPGIGTDEPSRGGETSILNTSSRPREVLLSQSGQHPGGSGGSGRRVLEVILVDVNLFVYSWDAGAQQHEAARTWLDARLSEPARVALPWESTLGFLRAVTNPRNFERPASVAAAWTQVREWLSCENVWIPSAGEEHGAILGALPGELGGGPKLIPDAHLAALAIEHGLVLCSTDGDFARFPGLRWMNPIRVAPL